MKNKKNTEAVEEQKVVEASEVTQEQEAKAENSEATQEQEKETKAPTKEQEEIPANVDAILKLYPHYEECYVDKLGFVYPKNTPEYQRKDAVLYKNKYYKS